MIPLADAIARRLGTPVVSLRPVAGGDINEAFVARLGDHRLAFVKTHARADPRMFPCEARGLAWLAEAGALRVPAVLAVTDATEDGPRFLVLEHLAGGPRRPDFDRHLGHGLAQLHRSGAPGFGWTEPNFVGSLPQDNPSADSWVTFYASRRLEPLVRRAIDRGLAPAAWPRQLARLVSRLPDVAGPPEPPARLHGDLWNGNVMADENGLPAVVDPAVYGGHREIDLAMMRLFGGLARGLLEAYEEVWPLAPGHEARVALYQLYPLLVHVNLFGGHYVEAAGRAMQAYL
jgi:fructosamine-3-kinase